MWINKRKGNDMYVYINVMGWDTKKSKKLHVMCTHTVFKLSIIKYTNNLNCYSVDSYFLVWLYEPEGHVLCSGLRLASAGKRERKMVPIWKKNVGLAYKGRVSRQGGLGLSTSRPHLPACPWRLRPGLHLKAVHCVAGIYMFPCVGTRLITDRINPTEEDKRPRGSTARKWKRQ